MRKLSAQTWVFRHAAPAQSLALCRGAAICRRGVLVCLPRPPQFPAHGLAIPSPGSPIAEAFPLTQSPRQSRLIPLLVL